VQVGGYAPFNVYSMTINGKQHKVGDVMRRAIVVNQNDSLETVLRIMMGEQRNSLIVINDTGEFVGSVNAIDIIKAVLPNYLEEDIVAARFANESLLKEDAEKARDTPVKDFMTTSIPTIGPDHSLLEAAAMAIQHGQGRITVVDEANKPIGTITRTEIKQVIGALLELPGAFE